MKMKTLTGNAIALMAPLLFLVPLVYFVEGTRGNLAKIAAASLLIYLFWFIYIIGWLNCIGLAIIGFAIDGLIKGDYNQVAEAIFGPFVVGLIIFGAIGTHLGKTPRQRLDDQIRDEKAM